MRGAGTYRRWLAAIIAAGFASSASGCEKPRDPSPTPLPHHGAIAPSASESPSDRIRPRDLQGRTVLVVTHPRVHVLKSVERLRTLKLLDVPNLVVVGVHHEAESEDYSKARRYVRSSKVQDMLLMTLSCQIGADELFRENACSPEFRELAQRSHGIVFTGGADIPPAIYGEKTALTTVIQAPMRQHWEISFLFHLLGGAQDPSFHASMQQREHLPVLGICMGMQAMNVATGGTLVQDIPSEIYRVTTLEDALAFDPRNTHRNHEACLHPDWDLWPGVLHPIRLTGAPELWGKYLSEATPVWVGSVHHQAVEKLGESLEVIATSEDGKVVEAVRHKRFPNALGVQFHPEHRVLWDPELGAKKIRGDSRRNPYAEELAKDAASLGFHRRFWSVMSARVRDEANR